MFFFLYKIKFYFFKNIILKNHFKYKKKKKGQRSITSHTLTVPTSTWFKTANERIPHGGQAVSVANSPQYPFLVVLYEGKMVSSSVAGEKDGSEVGPIERLEAK